MDQMYLETKPQVHRLEADEKGQSRQVQRQIPITPVSGTEPSHRYIADAFISTLRVMTVANMLQGAMRLLLATLLVASVGSVPGGSDSSAGLLPKGDPYAIIGVAKGADKESIVKAYRILARKWHPDKHRGSMCDSSDAEAVFASIAQAYEVLMDPTTREVLDRLGVDGLERLRNGDPTVRKGYLPNDEILRRLNTDKDGVESWPQWLVTAPFAYVASCSDAARTRLRWLPLLLGLLTDQPRVTITASSDADGKLLAAGASTRGAVTFVFRLSGKSTDFTKSDVTHTCGADARFLGMKYTYYLQCPCAKPGGNVSVYVNAGSFKVLGGQEYNTGSDVFTLAVL
jgi:hypothetical protein